ncbi:unnamed protein product, partial [marine sediment metagenome]
RSYLTPAPRPWVRVLRTYLLATVAFAGIYHTMYHFAPGSYAYAPNILPAAEASRIAKLQTEVKKGYRRLDLLARLRLWIASLDEAEAGALIARRKEQGSVWNLPDDITVKHEDYTVTGGVPAGELGGTGVWVVTAYWLTIEDTFGQERFPGRGELSGAYEAAVGGLLSGRGLTKQAYVALLRQLEAAEEEMCRSASRQLRGGTEAFSFSLLDFLYFSIVTLGYGDIVPNTTQVRMVVLSQILLGLWLIGRGAKQPGEAFGGG